MPHRNHDQYDQALYVEADKYVECYESICEQLLSDRMATYHDKQFNEHTVYLDKILEDYAEEIEEGMNTKEVIEAEAQRIVDDIF